MLVVIGMPRKNYKHINLGQVVTGLMVLRNGGNMITKQYSYYTEFSITLLKCMTMLFDKVEMCKPMFSKAGNSETYLVGLGYKGFNGNIKSNKIISLLMDRLEKWKLSPLIPMTELGDRFVNDIIKSQSHFSNRLIERIPETLREFDKFYKRGKILYNKMFQESKLIKRANRELNEWRRLYPMKKLLVKDQLNILDFKKSRKNYKGGGNYLDRYDDNKIITFSGDEPEHKVMRNSLPDTMNDKRKLQGVKESFYSISNKKEAVKLIDDIVDMLNINKKDLKKMTITDGTANIGGNTLEFAKWFKKVNSIEINPVTYQALINNVKVYGYKNVNVILSSYNTEMNNIKQDIVFLDPPWGGSSYKSQNGVMLRLGNDPIYKVINDIKQTPKLVLLKTPYNTNVALIKRCLKRRKIITKKYKGYKKGKSYIKYIILFITPV